MIALGTEARRAEKEKCCTGKPTLNVLAGKEIEGALAGRLLASVLLLLLLLLQFIQCCPFPFPLHTHSVIPLSSPLSHRKRAAKEYDHQHHHQHCCCPLLSFAFVDVAKFFLLQKCAAVHLTATLQHCSTAPLHHCTTVDALSIVFLLLARCYEN